MEAAGGRFAIGGADADFYLEGEEADRTNIEVLAHGQRLELNAGIANEPILLNGMAVGGTSALSDRDEIDLGPYKIVINDVKSAPALDSERHLHVVNEGGLVNAYGTDNRSRPEHLQASAAGANEGWASPREESSMRAGKKCVFGTPMEENELDGTVYMSSEEFASHTGFDMKSSQRFAGSALQHLPLITFLGPQFDSG